MRNRAAVLGAAMMGALAGGALVGGPGCQGRAGPGAEGHGAAMTSTDEPAIARTLDALHEAASRADEARYFALFAPDAVFLGTDAGERWTLEEFRAYAHPIFSRGRGWTYTVGERHVAVGPDGRTAWFDESLTNAKLGACRGSGVLVKGSDGRWRIAQYNLSIPIPNDLAERVAGLIRAQESGVKGAGGPEAGR